METSSEPPRCAIEQALDGRDGIEGEDVNFSSNQTGAPGVAPGKRPLIRWLIILLAWSASP
jgi:hypothetical protein